MVRWLMTYLGTYFILFSSWNSESRTWTVGVNYAQTILKLLLLILVMIMKISIWIYRYTEQTFHLSICSWYIYDGAAIFNCSPLWLGISLLMTDNVHLYNYWNIYNILKSKCLLLAWREGFPQGKVQLLKWSGNMAFLY